MCWSGATLDFSIYPGWAEVERTPSSDEEGDIYKFDFVAAEDATAFSLLGNISMAAAPRMFDWLSSQFKRFPLVLFIQCGQEPYWSTSVSILQALHFSPSLTNCRT